MACVLDRPGLWEHGKEADQSGVMSETGVRSMFGQMAYAVCQCLVTYQGAKRETASPDGYWFQKNRILCF